MNHVNPAKDASAKEWMRNQGYEYILEVMGRYGETYGDDVISHTHLSAYVSAHIDESDINPQSIVSLIMQCLGYRDISISGGYYKVRYWFTVKANCTHLLHGGMTHTTSAVSADYHSVKVGIETSTLRCLCGWEHKNPPLMNIFISRPESTLSHNISARPEAWMEYVRSSVVLGLTRINCRPITSIAVVEMGSHTWVMTFWRGVELVATHGIQRHTASCI
jgi:hypothetical protein